VGAVDLHQSIQRALIDVLLDALAQLVQQRERRLVRHTQVTGHGAGADPFDVVHEEDHGLEDRLQRDFVIGELRFAGDREVPVAGDVTAAPLAPPRQISVFADLAAPRAHLGSAASPSKADEERVHPCVGHLLDLGDREVSGRG
jgi:hypothetical protein